MQSSGMRKVRARGCFAATAGVVFAAGTGLVWSAGAQALPDAPSAVSSSITGGAAGDEGTGGQQAGGSSSGSQAGSGEGVQTKRILGIIPNFRSVSADQKLPPLTVKEKFVEASQDNFDYSSIFLPAALAGYADLEKSVPEFGSGGVAYGRYLWHAVVDQTVENYTVEFILPALTHEDPRYYTKAHGGFAKRAGYSLSRVVVTRTDNDTESFNYSEVVGAAVGAGLSNLYYPAPERTVGSTLSKFGTSVGVDAATFMFKEFWPDINKKLFRGK